MNLHGDGDLGGWWTDTMAMEITMCQCLAAKPTEGYPEVVDCRQGLAEIRTRWCKEHKDLDRFGPPEYNTLHPVWWFVFPLVLFDALDRSLLALI